LIIFAIFKVKYLDFGLKRDCRVLQLAISGDFAPNGSPQSFK
jgi:hypothetical protein